MAEERFPKTQEAGTILTPIPKMGARKDVSPGLTPGLISEPGQKRMLRSGLYGQRFAVSSQPAARTGCGAGIGGAAGTGILEVGCGPFTAVARAGFDISDMLSFSSESKGATSRSASTSFSSLVNSISFCRNTS